MIKAVQSISVAWRNSFDACGITSNNDLNTSKRLVLQSQVPPKSILTDLEEGDEVEIDTDIEDGDELESEDQDVDVDVDVDESEEDGVEEE